MSALTSRTIETHLRYAKALQGQCKAIDLGPGVHVKTAEGWTFDFPDDAADAAQFVAAAVNNYPSALRQILRLREQLEDARADLRRSRVRA